MGLYPKKLNGVSDLQKEKRRLEKELKQLQEDSPLSPGNIMAASQQGGEGVLGFVTPFLPDGFSTIVPIIQSRLQNMKRKKAKKSEETEVSVEKKKSAGSGKAKKMLKSAATEFIGGYLKWKAIELSYKGAKYLIKKQRERKAAEKLEQEMI